jgi:hypothetical protein
MVDEIDGVSTLGGSQNGRCLQALLAGLRCSLLAWPVAGVEVDRARNALVVWGGGVAFLVVLAIYLLSLTPQIGPFDSAWYLVLAKSIATGQGYRDLQQVGTPPHTHFPFGFPLLLSSVWLLFPGFPGNAYAFKLVPVLFAMAAWVVFCIYLLRHSDLGVTLVLATVLLSALTPLMVFFASQELMSETAYLFFSLLSILLFERVASQKLGMAFVLAVLALAMATFVRTVGLSLLVAVVLYFALGREFKRAALVALSFGLFIAPWALRNLWVGASPLSGDYGHDMWLKDYARPDLGTIGSCWELFPRALRNGYTHVTGSLLWLFLPQLALDRPVSLPAFLYYPWVKALIGLAIAGLAAWGLAAECRRRREVTLPGLYILVYLGPVLLQPWVGARNLIPITPFLVYHFFVGLRAVVSSGRVLLRSGTQRMASIVAWAAVLALLISFGRSDRVKIRAGLACYSGSYADPAEASFAEAGRWIRANTPQQARFFATLPNWLYLYSGRQVVPIPGDILRSDAGFRTPEAFLAYLRLQDADYLVLQPERSSYDGNEYDRGEPAIYGHTVAAFLELFSCRFTTQSVPPTLICEVLDHHAE